MNVQNKNSPLQILKNSMECTSLLCGSLWPWHSTSSGCGCREQPSDMEGTSEYIE